MLEIRDLTFSYGKQNILSGISFTLAQGRWLTIAGPNGSGKTTLLRLLSAYLKPDSGEIRFTGKELFSIPPDQRAKKIAYLPQNPPDLTGITVRELIQRGRYPAPGSAMTEDDVLQLTDLTHLQHRELHQLSGGERRRAWIAMTLIRKPELLLLDEPTAFLDPRGQFECLEMIQQLRKDLDLTVILILHDLTLAARFSDHILFMKNGTICAEGTPEEIMTPDRIRQIFGVTAENVFTQDGGKHILLTGTSKEN